jgi:hypothetical protein
MKLREGQAVQINPEYVCTEIRRSTVGSTTYGAGGQPIKRPDVVFRSVGSVAMVGASKDRALVVWPDHEPGYWIDTDRLIRA